MDISSVAAKMKVASVVLFGGALMAAMSPAVASATTSDDYDGNTKICRQAYPHWDYPDYMDVWFGRDKSNNPICYARQRGSGDPITLCWPSGKAVIVIDNKQCDCCC